MVEAALALLQEELEDVDIHSKKRAAERLHLIAKALGIEKTRNQLVPMLSKLVGGTVEEDEILFMFAGKLGGMVEYVGGVDHAPLLLPILETLCNVEETFVREKAVESIGKIMKQMDEETVKHEIIPIVKTLAQGEWFTPRVSACPLVAMTYKKINCNDSKAALRDLFVRLTKDDTPMVRRAAGRCIDKFAHSMDPNLVISEILPVFLKLTTDTQESVRMIAIGKCASLAECFSSDDNCKHILPLVKQFSGDRSWRVRYTIAKEYFTFSSLIDKEVASTELLPMYIELLRDPEGEVRSASSAHMVKYVDVVGKENYADKLIPVLSELVEIDSQATVRLALADACVDESLTTKLGDDACKKYLMPIWEHFLKDGEAINASQVRLKILNGLSQIVSVLGAEYVIDTKAGWGKLLKELYNASKAYPQAERELSGEDIEHPQWRVRQAIVLNLGKIARAKNGSSEAFVQEIWEMAIADEVNEVRMTASDVLGEFCSPDSAVGKDKVIMHYIPKLLEFLHKAQGSFGEKANYLHRVVFVHAVRTLYEYKDAWVLIADDVEALLDDPVPNVKIAILNVLAGMKAKDLQKFAKTLNYLADDRDTDVAEAASRAIAATG